MYLVQMKITIFDEIIDDREAHKVIHDLHDILVLSLCAVISGAEDYVSISEYGYQKEEFLREFLPLKNGIPSAMTISRVFRRLNPSELVNCLINNIKEVLELREKQLINIDGKVLRGTKNSKQKNSGVCVLTAWCSELNLALGQVKTAAKSNEKTAIPELLKQLDLRNGIVSIDAIACSNKIAQPIIEQGGDYIIAVKKNKKGLYEEVSDWLSRDRDDFDYFEHTDYVGGRIEQRKCTVCSDLEHLCQEDLLFDSQSIIKIESIRTQGEKVHQETRYYISSLKESAEKFNGYIRRHWSIENELHWHLDVSFNEDKSRARKDHSAENLSIIRKLALQGLKRTKEKIGVKNRRLKAAWNNDYLIKVLETYCS